MCCFRHQPLGLWLHKACISLDIVSLLVCVCVVFWVAETYCQKVCMDPEITLVADGVAVVVFVDAVV